MAGLDWIERIGANRRLIFFSTARGSRGGWFPTRACRSVEGAWEVSFLCPLFPIPPVLSPTTSSSRISRLLERGRRGPVNRSQACWMPSSVCFLVVLSKKAIGIAPADRQAQTLHPNRRKLRTAHLHHRQGRGRQRHGEEGVRGEICAADGCAEGMMRGAF